MHVTCIPLELEKRNKDFQTLHEQANKMLYSFNRFDSSFLEYWPDKKMSQGNEIYALVAVLIPR